MLHSIDPDRRLYVVREGIGYSCWGFDVIDGKARSVAAWCGCAAPSAPIGTPDHYVQCEAAMIAGRAYADRTGRRCLADLAPALTGLEGRRVELIEPDGTRRRFQVGRSTGWMPCHLALHSRRSLGGSPAYVPAGSTVRIVR